MTQSLTAQKISGTLLNLRYSSIINFGIIQTALPEVILIQFENFSLCLQANYVLGQNPMHMSYLVGYGDKYPKFVHHRGASIPADEKPSCTDGFKWLESSDPNPNVATGALVGGPFLNETYIDDRNNSMQAEPTTYNGALVVGLLSSLVSTSSAVQSFT